MIKFVENYKKTYFGIILGPFGPNMGKNEFSWKKGLSVFKYCAEENPMSHSGEKC